jgi:hypothetical protein
MLRLIASRRGLIGALLGAALSPARRARPKSGGWPAAQSRPAALAALCADLPPTDALGRACQRALPGGVASAAPLAELILADLPIAQTLAAAVRQRSRDDFRDGRLVAVDGWMLSLTEARLYALATLRARPPRAAG